MNGALDHAIEECIGRHVLEEFFRNRKEEVKKAMSLDFTMEQREELIREESFAEGRIISVDNIRENLGLDLQQACAAVGLTVEEYEEMKRIVQ